MLITGTKNAAIAANVEGELRSALPRYVTAAALLMRSE
jgi:hypothetical protein